MKLDHHYTKPTIVELAERIAMKAASGGGSNTSTSTVDGFIQVEEKRREELAKIKKKYKAERERSR